MNFPIFSYSFYIFLPETKFVLFNPNLDSIAKQYTLHFVIMFILLIPMFKLIFLLMVNITVKFLIY